MEEILRRHTRTVEHLFDAVLVLDLTGKVLDANPGAEKMFGVTRQAMLGRIPPGLDGAEGAKRTGQLLAEMRRQGSWSGELHYRRADATDAVAESVLVPLWDDYGRTVAALLISRDITELRGLRAAREASAPESAPKA
jgi:PAS domain S-box-containing protein